MSYHNPTFRSFEADEVKTRTVVAKAINYKNKKLAQGMVLTDGVKGLWDLKAYRKPHWVKNLTTGDFISEVSPHKTNITVYVPLEEIRVDDELLINKNNTFVKILITKKNKNSFQFRPVETWRKADKVEYIYNDDSQVSENIAEEV